MEKRYMISDAAKLVDVEAHVLRYWEDELDIHIPRNEMGHRYYTEDLIYLFSRVKKLKDQGFLLKAIKIMLPELTGEIPTESAEADRISPQHTVSAANNRLPAQPETSAAAAADSRMEQFQAILVNIVAKALEENNVSLGQTVSSQVSETLTKQMNYLMRLQDEREDERFRKLDETIRNHQQKNKKTALHRKRLFNRQTDTPTT